MISSSVNWRSLSCGLLPRGSAGARVAAAGAGARAATAGAGLGGLGLVGPGVALLLSRVCRAPASSLARSALRFSFSAFWLISVSSEQSTACRVQVTVSKKTQQ